MRKANRSAHFTLVVPTFVVVAVIVGCADTADPQTAAVAPPPPAVASEATATPVAQPGPEFKHSRASALALAQLQGYVEAGLYLYDNGAPGAVSSGHLRRGLNYQEAAMSRQLDLMGLDRDLVLQLAQAMENAVPATDLGAPIATLRAHFQNLVDTAKGNPLVQIRDLVDRIAGLYGSAVEGVAVVDPDAYYDALGFATVALARASEIKGDAGDALRDELSSLLSLWLDPARDDAEPAALDVVRDHLNRVRDVLRYAR